MQSDRNFLDVDLVRRIAHRAETSVFLARERKNGRALVVKQVRLNLKTDDDDDTESALHSDEARQELEVAHALQALPTRHPNILHYEAAIERRDWIYLAMEWCPNGDLYSFVERQPEQRIAEPLALDLWRQITSGVQFLHDHGIAHRDISLENVLLDEHWRPKVCDFGLSTFIRGRGQLSSGRVGKAYYMAPEVAAGKSYDACKADIWSLGVTLFILLTGSPLFQAAAPSDPAFAAFQRGLGVHHVLRLWKMDHLVSPQVIQMLDRMLRIDPAHRPATMREVLELGPDQVSQHSRLHD